ncbi:MAG: alpha/beta hydrolase fold domain-containing protein [Vicinamibacteria bacterium]
MPAPASFLRSMAAVGLASLAAAFAIFMFTPMPTMRLWLLHLLALEASLVTALLAALALFLARRAVPAVRRVVGVTAGLSLVAAVLPFALAAPVYLRTGTRFSLAEYVHGAQVAPVVERKGILLDAGSPGLPADVYEGVGVGPRPFVVVVHGGGWRGGERGESPWVSRALARGGITVIDVHYRLSGEAHFPAAIADVKCLLGRAREKAVELNIDPSRAALLGRSAGGEIALAAAYSAGDARLPPSCATEDASVSAVVGIYSPTALAWGHEHPLHPDVVRGPEVLEAFLGGTPPQSPEAYRLATPQTWIDGRPLPRTLLIHGGLDRMVSAEHSERLARALEEQKQPVRLLEIPAAEHGFDRRSGGIGEQLARAAILQFLAGL